MLTQLWKKLVRTDGSIGETTATFEGEDAIREAKANGYKDSIDEAVKPTDESVKPGQPSEQLDGNVQHQTDSRNESDDASGDITNRVVDPVQQVSGAGHSEPGRKRR